MENKRVLGILTTVVRVYLVLAVATLATVIVLHFAAPNLVTDEATVHAVIVAALAVVLPLRLRSLRAGRRSGLRAVGLISGALVVANMVGVVIPDLYPVWMRFEMAAVVALMAVSVGAVVALAVPRRA